MPYYMVQVKTADGNFTHRFLDAVDEFDAAIMIRNNLPGCIIRSVYQRKMHLEFPNDDRRLDGNLVHD